MPNYIHIISPQIKLAIYTRAVLGLWRVHPIKYPIKSTIVDG